MRRRDQTGYTCVHVLHVVQIHVRMYMQKHLNVCFATRGLQALAESQTKETTVLVQ